MAIKDQKANSDTNEKDRPNRSKVHNSIIKNETLTKK